MSITNISHNDVFWCHFHTCNMKHYKHMFSLVALTFYVGKEQCILLFYLWNGSNCDIKPLPVSKTECAA